MRGPVPHREAVRVKGRGQHLLEVVRVQVVAGHFTPERELVHQRPLFLHLAKPPVRREALDHVAVHRAVPRHDLGDVFRKGEELAIRMFV